MSPAQQTQWQMLKYNSLKDHGNTASVRVKSNHITTVSDCSAAQFLWSLNSKLYVSVLADMHEVLGMSSEIKPAALEQTLLWSCTAIYLFLCQSVVHAFDHGRWRVTGTGRGTTFFLCKCLAENINSCFC